MSIWKPAFLFVLYTLYQRFIFNGCNKVVSIIFYLEMLDSDVSGKAEIYLMHEMRTQPLSKECLLRLHTRSRTACSVGRPVQHVKLGSCSSTTIFTPE